MTSDEARPTNGRTASAGPPEFDTSVAHQARMCDYLLGGKDHWRSDREAAERVLAVAPEVRGIARANRAFLHRRPLSSLRKALPSSWTSARHPYFPERPRDSS
jgi:hypothetical protein